LQIPLFRDWKEGPKGGGGHFRKHFEYNKFLQSKRKQGSDLNNCPELILTQKMTSGKWGHCTFLVFFVLVSSLVFVAIGKFGTIACKTGSAKLSKDSSISFGCCCRDVYETLTGQISLDVAPFSSRIDDCHVSWPLGRIWCPSASSLLCTSSRSLCFLAYQVCSSLFYRDCDFALFFVPLLLENRLFA
jgi:hypothetical protein